MKNFFLFATILGLISCGAEAVENAPIDDAPIVADTIEQVAIDTIPLFQSIASNFDTDSLILPEGFSYRILFQEKTDLVTRADGQQFPAKGNHDLTVFIPDEEKPETKGLL